MRLLISMAWGADTYFAFVFTEKFHVSSKAVTGDVFILTLIGIVAVMITASLTGWISDKIKRQKPFIFAGGIVLAVGLVMLAFTLGAIWVYVAAGVMSLGYGTFLATGFAMCIRMLPNPEINGEDFGVFNIASTLPQSLVPAIAPEFLAIGGFTALFIAMAVLGVIGAALVSRIPGTGREGDPRWALINRPGALLDAARE